MFLRKIFVAACGLLLLYAVPAKAQDTSNLSVSGGYLLRLFSAPGGRVNLNGFYGSADYTLFKRFGAEAEVADSISNRDTNGDINILTGMVGPRFYPFGHRKITVYGHVLFGEGYYRVKFPAFGGFPPTTDTYTGLSWAAGGGIEIKHSDRWSIRIPQVDFGQTKFYSGTQSQSNFRISFGIVYHLGQK